MISQIKVNGSQITLPEIEDLSFSDVIQYVEKTLLSDQSMIASIKIDGIELTDEERTEIAEVPITSLGELEVFTAHPREIADETLQSLIPFTEGLAELAKKLGGDPVLNETEFRRFLDGIELMTEAVSTVKRAMHVEALTELTALEDDLAANLAKLFEARTSKNVIATAEILRGALADTVAQWAAIGIPALMTCRDN